MSLLHSPPGWEHPSTQGSYPLPASLVTPGPRFLWRRAISVPTGVTASRPGAAQTILAIEDEVSKPRSS